MKRPKSLTAFPADCSRKNLFFGTDRVGLQVVVRARVGRNRQTHAMAPGRRERQLTASLRVPSNSSFLEGVA